MPVSEAQCRDSTAKGVVAKKKKKIGADCSIIGGGTVSDVRLVLSKWSHKEKIGAASETRFSLLFF